MERDIVIRLARESDAAALAAIYAPYVLNTAITFEYEAPAAEEFASRMRHTIERYPYIVADSGGAIAGYAYIGAFHSRAAYDWAAETSIYLAVGKRGAGLGTRMYGVIERCAAAQGILSLEACIARPPCGDDEYLTGASIAFHEKLGYRMVGGFASCGYKFGRWYDMVWMEKHLAPHTASPAPVTPFASVAPRIFAEDGALKQGWA